MFVESKAAIHHKHKNGLALSQRRGGQETLVQWSNGDQRWVITTDLKGEIQLLAPEGINYDG